MERLTSRLVEGLKKWNLLGFILFYFLVQVVPSGFRKSLNYLKTKYDDPEIIITENGYADDGRLQDYGRIDYLTVSSADQKKKKML